MALDPPLLMTTEQAGLDLSTWHMALVLSELTRTRLISVIAFIALKVPDFKLLFQNYPGQLAQDHGEGFVLKTLDD